MKKLIHWKDGGGQLFCDNPVCKHQLAPGEVEWGPHLIGYPCPKCGADMLTAKDFADHTKTMRRIKRTVWVINFLFGWAFGTEEPKDWSDAEKIGIRVHNGATIISREKEQVE